MAVRAVIAVSPKAFIFIWWILLVTHVLYILYAMGVIMVHRYIIVQNLQVIVDYLGHHAFGYFQPVIVIMYIVIVAHAAEVLRTVIISLHAREFRFTRKVESPIEAVYQPTMPTDAKGSSTTAVVEAAPTTHPDKPTEATTTVVVETASTTSRFQRLIKLWQSVTDYLELYSISGARYDVIFFIFEVIEIGLQTFQAYKLSRLVAAVWINRLYAVVLVCNCWSTVVVHRRLHSNQLVKRVVLLVLDAFLDTVSNMVIPCAIFLPYYWEFDVNLRDFPMENYYNDVWIIQAISENQQVFVTSWLDFISKMSPHVLLIPTLLVLKELLVVDSVKDTRASITIEGKTEEKRESVPVKSPSKWAWLSRFVPSANTRVRIGEKLVKLSQTTTASFRAGKYGSIRFTKRQNRALIADLLMTSTSAWHDILFILCGLATLAVHLQATVVAVTGAHEGCMLSMRPWLVTLPTCASLEINCAHGQHNDGRDIESFHKILTEIDSQTLKALVLSGCTHLHVPPAIHVLPALQMIKIYNSTIETWDTEAELRNDHNPGVLFVLFADTNFTNGEIPIGMLSDDAPHQLVDVEFSGSNLVHLPSDLHAKWPGIMYFVLERSPSITAFPTVLAEMKIPQLMLGSNSITSVPTDLLADQAFWKLMLDGNPLAQLPNAIGTVQNLYKVGFAYTNVTTLPDWAVVNASTSGGDDVPFLGYADLFGRGSPLCASPESIASATAALKMWFHLDCSLDAPTHAYPIEREREWRATWQATLF